MREKLISAVWVFLQKKGFKVAEFSSFNSCFDIAARKEELYLLLKVLENIDSLRPESAKELQKLANVLNAVALIVGEKSKAFSLKEGVIFERHNIPAVNFKTFKQLFGREIPEIKYFKGKQIVELDFEKLKKLRNELNLTMQELAEKIGSSVESIYRYEQGFNASLDSAKKLEKVLGEKLVKEKNILKPVEGSFKEDKVLDSGLKQMRSLGLKIAVFNHAPFKAFAMSEPLMINKGNLRQEIERKALILKKTRTIFDSHSMIIAKEFKQEKIEGTPIILERELEGMRKKKELLKLLKERES